MAEPKVDFQAVLTKALEDTKAGVRAAVIAESRSALNSAFHSDYITLVDDKGRTYAPEIDFEYLKALWSFARGERFNGEILRTAVTTKVTKAVEKAVADTLGSSQFIADLGAKLMLPGVQVPNTTAVETAVADSLEYLTREFKRAAGLPGGDTLTEKLAEMTSAKIVAFFGTAAGQTVVSAFAHVAATASGRIAIAKAVKLASLKLGGAAALKTFGAIAAKKIGVILIVQTLLAAMFNASAPWLASLRISNRQIQAVIHLATWIALGVLIAHALVTFPDKMARDAPPKIADEMDKQWPELSKSYSEMLLMEMARLEPEKLKA